MQHFHEFCFILQRPEKEQKEMNLKWTELGVEGPGIYDRTYFIISQTCIKRTLKGT